MPTVQFNATGRWVITDVLSDDHPFYQRIRSHGIMDEIEFTVDELRELVEVAERAHATSVHWLNTKLRIKRALREVKND